MTAQRVRLDRNRRALQVDGKTTVLQERIWQVLSMLLSRAPGVVSRQEMIDTLWRGNYLTGEKGLNQAMWIIRSALDDDARHPRFVRTIPRLGYQWISSAAPARIRSASASQRQLAVGLAAAVAIASAAAALAVYVGGGVAGADRTSSVGYGLSAYRVHGDIFVEMSGGCRRILRNADNLPLGEPVLSSDGREVAVAVYEEAACRLLTIDIVSGRKRDFGACPSEII